MTTLTAIESATAIEDTQILHGDCLEVIQSGRVKSESVSLIFTSPPYADQRKNNYGGIHPDDYVEWFLPRAEALKKSLKPDGSFVLNIKEKAVGGQRHTYVLELILALKNRAGYGLRNTAGTRRIAIQVSGPIGSGIRGSVYYTSLSTRSSRCDRNP